MEWKLDLLFPASLPENGPLSHEIAIKALQGYLRQKAPSKPNLEKLLKYAKILRVDICPT